MVRASRVARERDLVRAYLLRRAPSGTFPRSPECLPLVPQAGESEAMLVLRVRRTLARLAPSERERCRVVVLRGGEAERAAG